MFVQSGPFTECITAAVGSVRGVHNSLKIFYLPGLKQYSIYFFDILSIFLCLLIFVFFQYFSRPVSKIG